MACRTLEWNPIGVPLLYSWKPLLINTLDALLMTLETSVSSHHFFSKSPITTILCRKGGPDSAWWSVPNRNLGNGAEYACTPAGVPHHPSGEGKPFRSWHVQVYEYLDGYRDVSPRPVNLMGPNPSVVLDRQAMGEGRKRTFPRPGGHIDKDIPPVTMGDDLIPWIWGGGKNLKSSARPQLRRWCHNHGPKPTPPQPPPPPLPQGGGSRRTVNSNTRGQGRRTISTTLWFTMSGLVRPGRRICRIKRDPYTMLSSTWRPKN